MKPVGKKAESILIIEAVGFTIILLLSWGVAYFDAPRYIFGDPPTFNWQRALLRTAGILPHLGLGSFHHPEPAAQASVSGRVSFSLLLVSKGGA